jgi:hypothetical protein
MTQWIGQSTLTSSKIATEYALATEQDSEFIGTWQQKPIEKTISPTDRARIHRPRKNKEKQN